MPKTKNKTVTNEELSAAIKDGEKPMQLTIPAPNIRIIKTQIVGTAALVMNRFAAKAQIMAAQQEGSVAKNKKKREPKDFEKLYREAAHKSTEGWYGIPAAAFRNACIRACSIVGYKMTQAKMSVFIVEDGRDADGTPLVRLLDSSFGKAAEPEQSILPVRNATGVIDLRARPMWNEWGAMVTIKFDADQFTETDVMNLMARAGIQVGILEGRPMSKDSAGMGWGTWQMA